MGNRIRKFAGLFLVWFYQIGLTIAADGDIFFYKFDFGGMVCTNWPTGVRCTNPPPYAMNTAGSIDSHRHIISFRKDGSYALGFHKATFGSWYLSIYPYNTSTKTAGTAIWTASAYVYGPWLQVPGNSSLTFSKGGNLELRDPSGTVQWTPGTKGLDVSDFLFVVRDKNAAAAGNMILYNRKHQAIWQSTIVEKLNTFRLNTVHRPDMVCTNLPTGVECTPPVEYPMNTVLGNDRHRNIISKLEGGLYALGFEKQQSGHFYLSIYKFFPSTNSAANPIWRAKSKDGSLVKLDEKATISFRQKGVIELKTSKAKLVWTTGTDQAGATDVKFEHDVGNLFLCNTQRAIIWQSVSSSFPFSGITDH